MAIGLALGARLLISTVQIGDLELGIHTLIYCAGMVSVGFQLVSFSVLASVFAAQAGLSPPSPLLKRLFRFITLESSLLVGGLLLLAGLIATVLSVQVWWKQGFGPLQPGQITKYVIGAVVALMLGAQVIFNGFFLSLLGLGVRREGDDTQPRHE